VATLRREIQRLGALETGLSGSGPTVFGIFPSLESAREAQEQLALPLPARSWVVVGAPSN
jgi:4-diphosphocytidyl-2C-methyl-D-erythritol kinase